MTKLSNGLYLLGDAMVNLCAFDPVTQKTKWEVIYISELVRTLVPINEHQFLSSHRNRADLSFGCFSHTFVWNY